MWSRTLVAVLAALLSAVSLLGAYAELDALAARSAMAAGTPPAMHTRLPIPSLSTRSARRARLDTCSMHLNALRVRDGVDAANEIAPQCLALVQSILAQAPLSAYDWFIGAEFADDVGDEERMIRYLRRSFETAPAEQWIAQRRAVFAFGQAPSLPPDAQALVDRDLLLMLRTESGVRALARHWVTDPDLRRRIVDLAVTLDAERQLRLLTLVREQVGAPPGD